MKYCVVTRYDDDSFKYRYENSAKNLQREVNERIKMGWKPLGGISVSISDTRYIFAQAMVKEDDKDSKKTI